MFQWLFFWRTRQSSPPEPPKLLPEPTTEELESMSTPKELPQATKDTRPLALVHSLSERLREKQNAQERELQSVSTPAALPMEDKTQEVKLLPAGRSSRLKSAEKRRLVYFTRGCYADPGLHTSRLITRKFPTRPEQDRASKQTVERGNKAAPAANSIGAPPTKK